MLCMLCVCVQFDGEGAVRSEVPGTTIFRPATMTGIEDKFFNNYAQLVKRLPFIPLIDGGETRLQPVWVRDVADGEAEGRRSLWGVQPLLQGHALALPSVPGGGWVRSSTAGTLCIWVCDP